MAYSVYIPQKYSYMLFKVTTEIGGRYNPDHDSRKIVDKSLDEALLKVSEDYCDVSAMMKQI